MKKILPIIFMTNFLILSSNANPFQRILARLPYKKLLFVSASVNLGLLYNSFNKSQNNEVSKLQSDFYQRAFLDAGNEIERLESQRSDYSETPNYFSKFEYGTEIHDESYPTTSTR